MWQQAILLQPLLLIVLVTAKYNESINQTVVVQKQGKSETLRVQVTLYRVFHHSAPTKHKTEFNVLHESGATQFDHQLRVIQWRLMEAPGARGFTEILQDGGHQYNDSITMKKTGSTSYRSSTNSSFWYQFASNECDALLMRVDVEGAKRGPFYMRVTPNNFRMLIRRCNRVEWYT